MIYRYLSVLGLYVFLLSSCAFHLKNTSHGDLKHDSPMMITLQSVPPTWRSIMNRSLSSHGVILAKDATKSRYVLTLEQETLDRHIMSISSGASSRQYQLTYRLFFSLHQTNGPILIHHQSILTSRCLTLNNNNILGSQDEETHILDAMRHDAAYQLIKRIQMRSHSI